MYPARHGLPSNTVTVDIPVVGSQAGGRVTGWWMVPETYTARRVSSRGLILTRHVQGYTVLYLHGISNSRAYYHRLGLYKVFLGTLTSSALGSHSLMFQLLATESLL